MISQHEFAALAAAGHNRIPVVREVLSDLDTPLSVYLKLADGPYTYLLESVEGGETWGRYSIIGLPAQRTYTFRGNQVEERAHGELVDSRTVADPPPATGEVGLATVAREWGRIGCIGFGGPPAHIALLRRLCVDGRRWLEPHDFEDAVAACNLLPGPASTQLSIYCAWRVRGRPGALVGGLCFIAPGLILILALAALFLGSPPRWVRGAGIGAATGIAAVPMAIGGAALGGGLAMWSTWDQSTRKPAK